MSVYLMPALSIKFLAPCKKIADCNRCKVVIKNLLVGVILLSHLVKCELILAYNKENLYSFHEITYSQYNVKDENVDYMRGISRDFDFRHTLNGNLVEQINADGDSGSVISINKDTILLAMTQPIGNIGTHNFGSTSSSARKTPQDIGDSTSVGEIMDKIRNFDISISGSLNAEYGVISQPEKFRRPLGTTPPGRIGLEDQTGFETDGIGIRLSMKSQAYNQTKYGAILELNSYPSPSSGGDTSPAKRAYLIAEGYWGHLEVGSNIVLPVDIRTV